jgi:two-component system, OmpR family, sensor kinase
VRARILVTILLVAALGLVAAGSTAYLVGRQSVLSRIDERLNEQVAAARLTALGGDGSGTEFTTTRDALRAIVARVAPDRYASTLGILAGQPTFVPGLPTSFDIPSDPAFVDRVIGEVSDGTVRLGTASTNIGDLRYIAAPVAIDKERGIFVIAVNENAELQDFTASFGAYAIVAAGVVAIIGLIGWMVAGRLLAPIRQLRRAAEDITATSRDARIPVHGDDDVSQLTRTVNDMLDRLDAALTSQRRLLDDVRHELKTPITIVRGHLELLDPLDADDVRATRLIAIDELDRMSTLIDEIEMLAESRLLLPRFESMEASELTAEVFAKAKGFRGHRWHLAESASGTVAVDRGKIDQAWLQLVDNAAKYAPANSTIYVGSSDRDRGVEFWVQNPGDGIPAGLEDSIFDRSVRVGESSAPGSGLGLSIVRSIVAAHGGRMTVVSSESGTRIGFILPAQSTPARVGVLA